MRVWALGLALMGWAGAAWAEDMVLEGVEVDNAEACMTTLAEFNWLCRQFELEGWVNSFGRPYWPTNQIVIYRHDLDEDGLEDAIVKIQGGGYCARGGRLNCAMLLLFGDQPPSDAPHSRIISGGGHILVTTRNGVKGITFGGDSNDFSKKDEMNFSPLDELREQTLASPQRDIIGN